MSEHYVGVPTKHNPFSECSVHALSGMLAHTTV